MKFRGIVLFAFAGVQFFSPTISFAAASSTASPPSAASARSTFSQRYYIEILRFHFSPGRYVGKNSAGRECTVDIEHPNYGEENAQPN